MEERRYRFCCRIEKTGEVSYGPWLSADYCNVELTLESLNARNKGVTRHWIEKEPQS